MGDGRFVKGERRSQATEFKPGQHWRPHQAFRDIDWLHHEYITLERSAGDIARQFGVGDTAIHFWLKKHGIQTRTTSQARAVKHWGAEGEANHMFGKRGEKHHGWRGGSTPERQAFYSSMEWRIAARAVWQRDYGTCQRCGVKANDGAVLHIHHIVAFVDSVELRAVASNLVLLCSHCHRFVHSTENVGRQWIGIDLNRANEPLQAERLRQPGLQL